jgi:DnaJ-class molecular chaperone
MNGYGIPNTRTGRKGKIYIKVIGKVPKIEDEETLRKIEAIKNELD